MDQIPPLAWIIIALIILLTFIINIVLIALLRNRNLGREFAERLRERRRSSNTAQSVRRFQEVLRDPFQKEREQLNELSDLVDRLQHPSTPGSTSDGPTGESQTTQESGEQKEKAP